MLDIGIIQVGEQNLVPRSACTRGCMGAVILCDHCWLFETIGNLQKPILAPERTERVLVVKMYLWIISVTLGEDRYV